MTGMKARLWGIYLQCLFSTASTVKTLLHNLEFSTVYDVCFCLFFYELSWKSVFAVFRRQDQTKTVQLNESHATSGSFLLKMALLRIRSIMSNYIKQTMASLPQDGAITLHYNIMLVSSVEQDSPSSECLA